MLIAADGERLPAPQKLHALLFGVFVLEVEGRNVVLTASIEQVDGLRAKTAGGVRGVDGGVSSADHDHRSAHLANVACLVGGDQLECVHHTVRVLAGNAEPLHRAEAEAEEDEVKLRFESYQFGGCPNAHSKAELNAKATDHLPLAHAVCGAQFIFGHAVGVQTSRQWTPLDDGGLRAPAAKLCRAGQRCRTAPDAGHAQLERCGLCGRKLFARGVESVHGVALQKCNLNRLAVLPMQYTGAFAEYVYRADTRAT